MDKLDMHTPDKVDGNINKIGNLFPNCITETLDENGKTIKAIDFDMLKQELSKVVVDGPKERYQFTWPDKKKSMLLANSPISATLRPCRTESVKFDSTENLYIEGDNLDVLKLLQETYLGKVKMIYIDPPYNTGNDFVYEDDFDIDSDSYKDMSGDYDDQGNRLRRNNDSNGRFHTDWLNMMYPRLKLARDLLSEDGVIFISIDDGEQSSLKRICDDIFGEINSQAIITYVRKTSGKQDSTNFMKSTEYILIYSKSSSWDCTPIIASERVIQRYNKESDKGVKFREIDLRKTGNSDRREDRPLMWYPFYYNPKTEELCVSKESDLSYTDKGFVEILPYKPDGTEGRWRWGYQTASENLDNLVAKVMPKYKQEGKYTIYEIDFIDKKGEIRTVKEHTFWDRTEFNSDNAIQEFKKLNFSNQLFPFPKCSSLIKHMIHLANSQDEIILDFFSGSATTAHAVMQLNAEDGGKRKFIMVQIPEATEESSEAFKAGYKNICEIGKERIRRAGKKVKEEAGLNGQNLDIGFRVLKLDSSNMKNVYYSPEEYVNDPGLFDQVHDNIKEDRSGEDLLFQIMLDLGIELSADIKTETIGRKKIYTVKDNYLIACFDADITDDNLTEIAKRKPFYAVLRDSSFTRDDTASNFEQIFATWSPETIKKVL
jgi:adenine-specific DNA-methyltransferase